VFLVQEHVFGVFDRGRLSTVEDEPKGTPRFSAGDIADLLDLHESDDT
jgi:hypothetical protein